MRRIEWTEDAVANLDAIANYISAFNPAAAQRLAERLIAAADSLAEFSERGRDVGDGRRELTIVWPYLLRYRGAGANNHPAHSTRRSWIAIEYE